MGPSPATLRLSLLPAYPSRDQVCVHPSCSPWQHGSPLRVGGHLLGGALPCERHASLYSRGPRSSPGFAVPVHHHLIGPIRPTRGHPTDFAARRLIRGAFAVRERLGDPRAVPVFRCPFLSGMPSPKTPGSSDIHKFQSRDVDIGLRRCASGSALPKTPANPFHAGGRFRGFHGSRIYYGLPDCSPPCTDLTGFSASGGFYFQASNGSVAFPVTGYGYSIDWTPILAGLSPAGMAARLAARHNACRYLSRWNAAQISRPRDSAGPVCRGRGSSRI